MHMITNIQLFPKIISNMSPKPCLFNSSFERIQNIHFKSGNLTIKRIKGTI
uniref:Uncharacterized protein n=1 Tax=Rhizophora mucronata TaxID=61149 RepID=A0A2P2LWQ4_RHIMU